MKAMRRKHQEQISVRENAQAELFIFSHKKNTLSLGCDKT